jgi:hypothetical protein
MLKYFTSKSINQVVAPGLFFWRRKKRLLLRRWKRLMLLPETILVAGMIIFGSYMADHFDYQPGQQALASVNGMIQDGVQTPAMRHRQKQIQESLRDDAHNLLTLSSDEVVNALSYPDLKRNEGDMTVLQFRGESCILDLYLSKSGRTAVNYEFRSRQVAGYDEPVNKEIRPQTCVDDILKSRHI